MIIVHSLALVSLPLWFIGAFGLSRRIGWCGSLSLAALIIYGFGLAALMNAVVIEGLVTPGLARAITNATPDKAIGWKIAFNHTPSGSGIHERVSGRLFGSDRVMVSIHCAERRFGARARSFWLRVRNCNCCCSTHRLAGAIPAYFLHCRDWSGNLVLQCRDAVISDESGMSESAISLRLRFSSDSVGVG